MARGLRRFAAVDAESLVLKRQVQVGVNDLVEVLDLPHVHVLVEQAGEDPCCHECGALGRVDHGLLRALRLDQSLASAVRQQILSHDVSFVRWLWRAPPRIRTENLLILSQTPLPVGLEGHCPFC